MSYSIATKFLFLKILLESKTKRGEGKRKILLTDDSAATVRAESIWSQDPPLDL